MRSFHRERRLTWYVYLMECLIVLYTLHENYNVAALRYTIEVCLFAISLIVTRFLTVQPSKLCSDLIQGAVTISCGMAVYLCYSVESGSDRLLPACMFFVMMECTMYKNLTLNIFVTAMNTFLCLLTLMFSGLNVLYHTYSRIEFLFIFALMLISSALMLFMQTKDLFTERVAKEDEKSLDDLLQLVEMKCEDATAAAAAKSSFLANMSHEIRTPINAVLGMNEMILREEQDEEIRGYAQNIQSAGTALLSLINDILDISKIESGKMEVVPERYELNSLLYDILVVIQPRVEKKNLQVLFDIDENIPNVLFGDEVRIRQIITNILTNAVKYTEKGSITLRVKMEQKDDQHIILKVAVKDTGIGIKESRDVLFAAFQRGGDLKAHHIEGTGLGLAITQQLLEMMGSNLEMESNYGKGSIFYFDLEQTVLSGEPMGNLNDLYQKRVAQKQNYKETFTAPDAHVLVVDDNPMNLTVVKSLLKQTLVQIDMAEDGVRCLEKCMQCQYDLIFMDHLMPNMDGIEAFRALRADKDGLNFRTPIIILTANAVAGMKQKYLDEGFSGFLSKPVRGQLIEEALRQYLPQEKVILTEGEELEDEEEKERQKIFSQVIEELKLMDVDLEDALQYSSGTIADVLENMKGYLHESKENRQLIQLGYESGNWNDLKIHVHALKSTSRVIGAIHMAYLAEQMEQAAGEENVTYINSKLSDMLGEQEQLCNDLERLMSDVRISRMIPQAVEVEEPLDDYIAQAKQFLQGVNEYDVDFEELRAFCNCYPAGGVPLTQERENLARAVEDFDYELSGRILGRMIDLMGSV